MSRSARGHYMLDHARLGTADRLGGAAGALFPAENSSQNEHKSDYRTLGTSRPYAVITTLPDQPATHPHRAGRLPHRLDAFALVRSHPVRSLDCIERSFEPSHRLFWPIAGSADSQSRYRPI